MTTPAAPPRAAFDLAAALKKRGIDAATWSALQNSTFPGAREESILMVIDYCAARHLDPLKKPCHIVSMDVRNARTGQYETRDVVLPGIYEHRATAQRTGAYLGHSEPQFGPLIDYKSVPAPEYCALTMFRLHDRTHEKIAFPVRVFFREVVALDRDGKPNARWRRAPWQMLLKCTEAAGLREAFPDEIGGEHTAEELDGARAPEVIDAIAERALPPVPEQFEQFLQQLRAAAEQGTAPLQAAWKNAPTPGHREYLNAADPATWNAIKARAAERTAAASAAPTDPEGE